MSKGNILNEEEFSKYKIKESILNQIKHYQSITGLKNNEINILDWGCGRGMDVLWFCENGYNCFGVDIDENPINNGLVLFRKKGYNNNALSLLSPNGRADFPDNFFHITISDQVFEHVKDIHSVANEIKRLTKKDGIGFHIFPPHLRIIEGHLFMPFLHWFPKGKVRKYLISFFVRVGLEPKWNGLKTHNAKVESYYNYTMNFTYYRTYKQVRNIFEDNGFLCSFETIKNPILHSFGIFRIFANVKMLQPLINILLLNFLTIEMLIKKK